MRSLNKGPWLLLALIAAALYGYHLYEKSAARRGSIALEQFRTLADAVDAEARYKFVELTKGDVEDIGLPGASGHSLAQADLSYKWELVAQDPALTNVNFTVIATAIKSKLSNLVRSKEETLRWYYPDLRMSVDASVVDSDWSHQKAIRVSLNCTN